MLMLHFHLVLSIELIALAFGIAIIIWSKTPESNFLAKFIGYSIIIISMLNILCTSYYVIKYRLDGSFNKPCSSMMMPHQSMLPDQMMMNKNLPMMADQTKSEPMMPSTTSEPVMKNQNMQNQTPDTTMPNQINNSTLITQDTPTEAQPNNQ
jgi:hypothetical protein